MMLREFREFINRGNVVDLAVAVVMGAAFGGIVTSLVDDIIMPLLGIFTGGINFTRLSFGLGEAQINYGNFLQAILTFLIIAWAIFLLVRAFNAAQRRLMRQEEAGAKPAELPPDIKLLSEIRDLLQTQVNRPNPSIGE
jgi:large conductance mechanosensitive channel